MKSKKLYLFIVICISIIILINCNDHVDFIEIKQPCNLITPIDNEIIYTNKPTFTWESVKGADTYLLYLNQVQYTETGELFYSIPEEQALSEGEYTWQLRSKNEFQYYPCGTKNFSIIVPGPADLQTPLNGECIYTKTPTLQWFDKGGIEYYVVEVSDRKDFSVIIDSSELTETSYTTKPLENGKYYWRVTSYDVNGEVHTSETYSMTINNDFVVAVDLPVPTAISPIESDIYFQPVTFTWSSEGIGEHFSYEFELYKNGFEDIVFHASGIQTPLYVLNETEYKLENGTKYNWRVRAVFYTCTGDWCTKNNFNKNAISIAEAISPKDVCLTNDTVVFKWTSGSGMLKYKVEIATDSGFSNIIDTIETTNTEYTKLLPNGEYYWRIISYDKNGSEYVSSTYRFVVAKGISTSINISSPNGVNIDNQPLTFTWTGGTLAAPNSYELELSKDDFSTIAYSKTGLVDPSYILNESEYKLLDGAYKWRVRVNYYDCPASDWVVGSFTRICDTWITEDFTVTVTEMGCRTVKFDMNPATFSGLDKYIIQLSGANTNTIDPASSSQDINNLNIGLTDYVVTAKSVDGCTDIVKTGSFAVHWILDYKTNGTGSEVINEIEIYNGYAYTTGYFKGTVDFGNGKTATSNSGSEDIFVIKYDLNTLTPVWLYTAGTSSIDISYDIAIDTNNGNCYITGYYANNSINFGGGVRPIVGNADIFIVKLNGVDGSWLWDKTAGSYTCAGAASNTGDLGEGIAVDSDGDVYVTGNFGLKINLGGGFTSCYGSNDNFFVVKYDKNGFWKWNYVEGFSIANDMTGLNIAVDNSKNVFISSIKGGDHSLTTTGDVSVIKLNSLGSKSWEYIASGTNRELGRDVVIDSTGNVFCGGQFSSGTCNFGAVGSKTLSSNSDIFIVKIDNTTGLSTNIYTKGGTLSSNIDNIRIDNSGTCYAIGNYSGTIDFGGGSRISSGSYDIFVLKLDNNLNYLCDYTIGGINSDESSGIALDNNLIYLTGIFIGTLDLGGGNRMSNGANYDAFIIKSQW